MRFVFLMCLVIPLPCVAQDSVAALQGAMVGEPTARTAIVQIRLTGREPVDGAVPGRPGVARCQYGTDQGLTDAQQTPLLQADENRDFIIQHVLGELTPGTQYYYQWFIGPSEDALKPGPTGTFKTLPDAKTAAPVRFVVVTGMNYDRFHAGYRGEDRELGYPALVAIQKLKPDFFVGTGDNIYYDTPVEGRATDAPSMRVKWQEQFVQERYRDLFATTATYWEKDDHDHRYNDNDLTGNKPPSPELGSRIFLEQLPIVDPNDPQAVTYRTHRVGKLVQLWFLENRDYRSPNSSPDGPEKTIWGETQREWLKKTLLASDAPFKFIISPTPMVGPDDRSKRDNHTNLGGFRHEGDAFFAWAKEQGFLEKGLYLICGDRHWQYHSIHPSGFDEFSTGALVDANSRLGVKPGSGTDPEGLVRQPYTSREPSGGFLEVVVTPAANGTEAAAEMIFRDEHGEILHRVEKTEAVSQ